MADLDAELANFEAELASLAAASEQVRRLSLDEEYWGLSPCPCQC